MPVQKSRLRHKAKIDALFDEVIRGAKANDRKNHNAAGPKKDPNVPTVYLSEYLQNMRTSFLMLGLPARAREVTKLITEAKRSELSTEKKYAIEELRDELLKAKESPRDLFWMFEKEERDLREKSSSPKK